MSEPKASPEDYLTCALCGMTCHPSIIAMRGPMSFCQACATTKPAECLSKLKGGGNKRPVALAVAVFAGVLAIGGAVWIGRATAPDHNAPEPRPIVAQAATPAPVSQRPQIPSATPAPEETPQPTSQAPIAEPEMAASRNAKLASESKSVESVKASENSARQVTDAANIHLLFVTQPGTDGALGLSSRLYATREAPDPVTAKLESKVGSEMEGSFQEALRFARKQPRDWEKDFSIRLSFEDRTTPKDGGSAGTAFAIAMLSAMRGIGLDPGVAVTGDLSIDGTVQPVGAVVEKLRGAIAAKCKVTLIPKGNERDPLDLALLDGTSPLWDTQIFSVDSIEEAFELARSEREEKKKAAIAKFDQLRSRLPAVVTPNYLLSPVVQTELKGVLELAPNHLSAAILLRAAENQLPKELSLNRSVTEVVAASYLFVQDVLSTGEREKAAAGKSAPGITLFPDREYWDAVKKLDRLNPILDRRSMDLKASCLAYSTALRGCASYKSPSMEGVKTRQQLLELIKRETGYQSDIMEQYQTARSKLALAIRKLSVDGDLIKELMKK